MPARYPNWRREVPYQFISISIHFFKINFNLFQFISIYFNLFKFISIHELKLKLIEMIWNELKWIKIIWNDLKWIEIIWNELKWFEMNWNELIRNFTALINLPVQSQQVYLLILAEIWRILFECWHSRAEHSLSLLCSMVPLTWISNLNIHQVIFNWRTKNAYLATAMSSFKSVAT